MDQPFAYLEDEQSLSRQHNLPLPPLRKFNLGGLGIEPQGFLRDLAPSFADLPWDYYDVRLAHFRLLLKCYPEQQERLESFFPDYYAGKTDLTAVRDLIRGLPAQQRHTLESVRPHRQRAITAFQVSYDRYDRPAIERVPLPSFSQQVGAKDYRSMKRVFGEAAPEVVTHRGFQQWLQAVARIVRDLEDTCRGIRLVIHQMRTLVRRGTASEAVPEGIHQDGAKYIVSALVGERNGVIGGESVVFGPDRQTRYLSTVLQPGEGIFQADTGSPLWHYASPIQIDPDSDCAVGTRGIFGLDVNIDP